MTRREFIKHAAACAALPLVPTAMAKFTLPGAISPCGPYSCDLPAVSAQLAVMRERMASALASYVLSRIMVSPSTAKMISEQCPGIMPYLDVYGDGVEVDGRFMQFMPDGQAIIRTEARFQARSAPAFGVIRFRRNCESTVSISVVVIG